MGFAVSACNSHLSRLLLETDKRLIVDLRIGFINAYNNSIKQHPVIIDARAYLHS
jgi:hypothetical protein